MISSNRTKTPTTTFSSNLHTNLRFVQRFLYDTDFVAVSRGRTFVVNSPPHVYTAGRNHSEAVCSRDLRKVAISSIDE
jgi:hypothetical protein